MILRGFALPVAVKAGRAIVLNKTVRYGIYKGKAPKPSRAISHALSA